MSEQGSQEEFPEGGARSWMVVFGCWLALFSSSGIMNSLGVFTTYVKSHQLSSYEESTVAWIFSVYVFLCFGCGVYVGPLFDKYGPRWLILAGSSCHVTSIMLLSICTGMLRFTTKVRCNRSLTFDRVLAFHAYFWCFERRWNFSPV